MRVLHLIQRDSGNSGTEVAMNRLIGPLTTNGIDSRILCEKKTSGSPQVSVIRTWGRVEKPLRRITSLLGLNDIHRLSSFRITKHQAFLDAHLIHFHSIKAGFVNYLALPSLTKNKPGVFTLHDMWALTGHCAVNYDCDRWKLGCGKCPYPEAYPSIRRDATRIGFIVAPTSRS